MERIVAENWSVLMTAPVAFLAVLCLGGASVWIVVSLIYDQRLTHYQELIANYRDVLEEKLPVRALRPFPSKRSKKMSLGLILIFGGAVAVVIGALFVSLDRSPSPPKVVSFGPIQPTHPAVAAIPGAGSTADGPRQLLDRTPRELLALYEGRTPFQADPIIQPYKGRWIKAQGKIINLLPDGVPGRSIAVLQDGDVTIECRLDERWTNKIVKLNKGEILNVLGQIGPSQNGSQLYLVNCEIA
jgi:hypothetical protein